MEIAKIAKIAKNGLNGEFQHKKKKNTHFKLFQFRPPDPLDTNVLKMARRAIFKTFVSIGFGALTRI